MADAEPALTSPALVLAALLQAAPPVPTTPPPPGPPPPAQAKAEALLAGEQAADVFANESAPGAAGPGAVRLRHRPSGFLCRLDSGGARLRVQVYATPTRGDDVRCSQLTAEGLRVVFFYRAPGMTLAQLASNAEREGRSEVRDDPTSPLTPDRRTVPASGAGPGAVPEHVVETLEGVQLAERFVVGKVGDWAVQLRLLGRRAAAAPSTALEADWAALLADRAAPSALAPAPRPAAATPEEAQAQAARLLARAEAGAWFEVARDGPGVALRHRASGAVCTFEPGVAENEVTVLNHPPPGSDLKCVTRALDAVVSTFVSHLEPAPTLKAAFDSFVSEIRTVHPDAKPFVGTSADVKPNAGAPETLTARFTYAREGRPVFSRLQVAMLNGWIVEQRLDGPPEHATAFDLLGGLFFLRTIGAPAATRPTTATAPLTGLISPGR